jgi:hypothetical protein
MEDERARRQATRKAEMERLRAENEQEERRLLSAEKGGEYHDYQDGKTTSSSGTKPQEQIIQVNEEELEGLDEEEQMRRLLGIEGFGTTKNQKVESNHSSLAAGAAKKNKARKYRQYMNRTFLALCVTERIKLRLVSVFTSLCVVLLHIHYVSNTFLFLPPQFLYRQGRVQPTFGQDGLKRDAHTLVWAFTMCSMLY